MLPIVPKSYSASASTPTPESSTQSSAILVNSCAVFSSYLLITLNSRSTVSLISNVNGRGIRLIPTLQLSSSCIKSFDVQLVGTAVISALSLQYLHL